MTKEDLKYSEDTTSSIFYMKLLLNAGLDALSPAFLKNKYQETTNQALLKSVDHYLIDSSMSALSFNLSSSLKNLRFSQDNQAKLVKPLKSYQSKHQLRFLKSTDLTLKLMSSKTTVKLQDTARKSMYLTSSFARPFLV